MTYSIEKLAGEPIVVFTATMAYHVARDLPRSNADGIALLNSMAAPITYINDIRALQGITLEDVMLTAEMTAGVWNSVYRHPMIHEVLFVTVDPLVRASISGLIGLALGQLRSRAFDTLDEALGWARDR